MDPDGNPDNLPPPNDDPNTHDLGPTDAPEGVDPIPGLAPDDDDMGGDEPMGEGDDDDGQYFEDGTDVLYLPADHNLMQRVQAALTE